MCVTAIRVYGLWPGWGADPQGIKPACLSVQVICVGVSAPPTIHRQGAGGRRNTPTDGGRSFTHMPMVGRSPVARRADEARGPNDYAVASLPGWDALLHVGD